MTIDKMILGSIFAVFILSSVMTISFSIADAVPYSTITQTENNFNQHTSEIISCSLTKPVATLFSVLCLHAPSVQTASLHKTIELVIVNYFTDLILDCKLFSLGWCNLP